MDKSVARSLKYVGNKVNDVMDSTGVSDGAKYAAKSVARGGRAVTKKVVRSGRYMGDQLNQVMENSQTLTLVKSGTKSVVKKTESFLEDFMGDNSPVPQK